ncbi:hypothetical protein BU17DRAFT_77232 [Hysterangium stoloniferum]|nr:hypothetical protein BU17DRAFT_77232 [Hysterangium stoloniferum]
MSSNPTLDPYTKNAEKTDLTLQVKIDGLKAIVKNCETGMLTTRSREGHLHSRAMTPAKSSNQDDLHFVFIGNNASDKFDEIKNDDHVNVSFYDHSTTDWVSVAGTACVTQDKTFIKRFWSPNLAGYFGDLHDGVHKGDVDDPRVSAIEVIPREIRYWVVNKGKLAQSVQAVIGVATDKRKAQGELRTITPGEIQSVEGLHQK